jgi:hypothetical protein
MDETLKPVQKETIWAIRTIPMTIYSPACPVIHGNRIYIITPRIVRMEGVKTPENVPYFFT